MRKYPPTQTLSRFCSRDYQIIDRTDLRKSFTLETGTLCLISVLGLHHDPNHFAYPIVFNPDRFIFDEHLKDSNCYLPFGKGPRQCIGIELGILVMKITLANIIKEFNVHNLTENPLFFNSFGNSNAAKPITVGVSRPQPIVPDAPNVPGASNVPGLNQGTGVAGASVTTIVPRARVTPPTQRTRVTPSTSRTSVTSSSSGVPVTPKSNRISTKEKLNTSRAKPNRSPITMPSAANTLLSFTSTKSDSIPSTSKASISLPYKSNFGKCI